MSDDLLVTSSAASEAFGGAARFWSPSAGRATDDPGKGLAVEARTSAAVSPQRRREPRFEAVENRLWLQWWQDGEYLGRSATLVNVSRSGAMIVSWVLLREHQRVRIYLEDSAYEVGVHAVVLGVCEAIRGMHQTRLRFLSPCPDHFIEAAANGFETWLRGK